MFRRFITLIFICCITVSNGQKKKTMHKHTNALINETSPYLLQHAHNPVNWEAWSDEVLARAKKENKPLLISIGYAACHWCHVMEEECFENEEVAEIMNQNFINIKIDREERPDVDHIYMDALQMMTGSGGWPLNIIALPDGRPFWGATYVKKDDWMATLNQLSDLYRKNPAKIVDYAEKLAEGIKSINLVETSTDNTIFSMEHLDDVVKTWSKSFDTFLGGYKQAPKFMMPTNLEFLLRYGTINNDVFILEYVNTTLTRMAYGGIFDQVRGGFSRYAVDTKWHVPHFEKMLYDNGQLVSLYAKAYAVTNNPLYKKVVDECIAFVTEELMDKNYAFYSSLDADSLTEGGELEEGAYYVWTKEELKKLLGSRFDVFKDFYNINSYGLWEHENYVLIRDKSIPEIAKKHKISTTELNKLIADCKSKLEAAQTKRKRPRLDDKVLTSWNGLMLKGLVDAYKHLGNETYLTTAINNAEFINENLIKKNNGVFHNHKNGKSSINGFLEDYATVIDAFIGLYQVTFDEKWLNKAKVLTDYCLAHFYDNNSGLFFFTSKNEDFVIRRTIEKADNVIPASNSIMAHNLFKLSRYFFDDTYEETAAEMLKNIQGNFDQNGANYTNWLNLSLNFNNDFYEIAVVGDDFDAKTKELNREYLPNIIIAASKEESSLELLQNRHSLNNTLIYVCTHGSCKIPVSEAKDALQQLKD